jgi:hypothetical protein
LADEVAIYYHALAPDKIKSIFHAGQKGALQVGFALAYVRLDFIS